MIAIRNGRVLTPDGIAETDIGIEGEIVVGVGGRIDAGADLDAAGAWVGPGLVDLHVHFRDPGQEWKEDIPSGSAAAAAGGFTAVLAMPNTTPPVDSGHNARYVVEAGRRAGLCEVLPAGCLTMARAGEVLSQLDELWAAGVRVFSDDGSSVADAGLLRLAMEYVCELGGVVAQHAEDLGLSRGGHMNEGALSSRLGVPGLPAAAEETVLARDLTLAGLTGVRYHAQHLSLARSAELVNEAKSRGLPVTAEVTPHHLVLDQSYVESLDPVFKMYPPLRTRSDVAALTAALAAGTIDAVATDHAPHAAFETEVPFAEAPRGIIGLETAAAIVNMVLGPDPGTFFQRMSIAPATIGGFARHGHRVEDGAPANLVIFDPDAVWTPTSFQSRSANSPFLGRPLRGKVLATIYNGSISYQTPAPVSA
ncbi:MAG TPA: dihydroorotase [Acidimicrobiia bacterium]